MLFISLGRLEFLRYITFLLFERPLLIFLQGKPTSKNSLSSSPFFFVWESLIFPSVLKSYFTGYRIIIFFLSFNTWDVSLNSLLTGMVSDRKSTVFLTYVSLYIWLFPPPPQPQFPSRFSLMYLQYSVSVIHSVAFILLDLWDFRTCDLVSVVIFEKFSSVITIAIISYDLLSFSGIPTNWILQLL